LYGVLGKDVYRVLCRSGVRGTTARVY
jgi:hypothetical protein